MAPLQRFLRLPAAFPRSLILFALLSSVLVLFFSSHWPLPSLARRPSRLSTSLCEPPRPLLLQRYGLMIDAGSTGSRIHVYRFSSCLKPGQPLSSSPVLPSLDHELFFKTQPGLSAYVHRPKDAAESLRPLLRAALEGVPVHQRPCTPIALKATAGLRLLGEKEAQEILSEVRSWLQSHWPFKLATQDDPVSIMDGADEGVHAWVTINYLLKLIGPSDPQSHQVPTAAVMDLGGASTQIVFKPQGIQLEPGAHVYQLDFGGRTHALYQHSHLGYGLMEARRAVHQLVAYAEMWRRKVTWSELSDSGPIANPCIQRGSTRQVVLLSEGKDGKSATFQFVGTGNGFQSCRRVVELILAKQTTCKLAPCAFAGVYQPSLTKTFPDGPIYALSYFYDRLYPLGFKTQFTLKELSLLVQTVCEGPSSFSESPQGTGGTGTKWEVKDFLEGLRRAGLPSKIGEEVDQAVLDEELNGRPEACLDLSFILGILSFGYEIEESRQIVVSKKIDGVELGWALGAAINMIEKNEIEVKDGTCMAPMT